MSLGQGVDFYFNSPSTKKEFMFKGVPQQIKLLFWGVKMKPMSIPDLVKKSGRLTIQVSYSCPQSIFLEAYITEDSIIKSPILPTSKA